MTREQLLEIFRQMLWEEAYCCDRAKIFKTVLRSQRKRIDSILHSLNLEGTSLNEIAKIIPDCTIEYAMHVLGNPK